MSLIDIFPNINTKFKKNINIILVNMEYKNKKFRTNKKL